MGKGSSPAAPDYMGIVQAQGELNKENLATQNYANRPTVNTPWGSQSWGTQSVIDPATGKPVTQWTQNTTLAPGLQSALDSQIGVMAGRSDMANQLMGRTASELGQQINYGGLPQFAQANAPGSMTTATTDYTPGIATGFNFGAPLPQVDSSFRDTVANQLMQRMQPVHDYQQSQLDTKLANQGFTVGSDAYKRAQDELGQRQAAERFQALDQSGNEAQRLFGMQMDTAKTGYNQNLGAAQFQNQALGQASQQDLSRMQAQNQAVSNQYNLNQNFADNQNALRQRMIAEEMQRRGTSLNEMNALLSGQQVTMPGMPGFNTAGQAQTPDMMGAAQAGYNAQLGAYNAQQAGLGNLLNAGATLGAAYMFSDRRLKSNIKRVGEHSIGVGIYDFTMMGMTQRGVIAQEVQAVRPDLVRRHASGFLQVNYGGL